jgi:hypothetical protein
MTALQSMVERFEAQIAEVMTAQDDGKAAGTLSADVVLATASGDFVPLLRGWRTARAIAWCLREDGRRHAHDGAELPPEDIASAKGYADRWRLILWGDESQPQCTGSQLLADIRDRLRGILVDEPGSATTLAPAT